MTAYVINDEPCLKDLGPGKSALKPKLNCKENRQDVTHFEIAGELMRADS